MNTKKKKAQTEKLLRQWATKKWWKFWVERKNYLGICYNLHLHRINMDLVFDHAESWEEFSGNRAYPVPGGRYVYRKSDNLWIGEYGESRKRLCLYLADVVADMSAEEFEQYII